MTVLNRNCKNEHPCISLSVRGKTFNVLPLDIMSALDFCGFLYLFKEVLFPRSEFLIS